jgi:hypothetical protein
MFIPYRLASKIKISFSALKKYRKLGSSCRTSKRGLAISASSISTFIRWLKISK